MFSVVSVILPTGWGECSHVTITQGARDLTVPGPQQSPEDMGPYLYRDPPSDMFKFVHYEIQMFGNWVVCILPECLLVL